MSNRKKKISFAPVTYNFDPNGPFKPLRESREDPPTHTTRTRYGRNGPYENVPRSTLWTTPVDQSTAYAQSRLELDPTYYNTNNGHNGPRFASEMHRERIASHRRLTRNRLTAARNLFVRAPKVNSHSLRAASGISMKNRGPPSSSALPTAFTRRHNRSFAVTRRQTAKENTRRL